MTITYQDFFTKYFPHGAFLVANFQKMPPVLTECVLSEKIKQEHLTNDDWKEIKLINETIEYDMFFTPNSVKGDKGIGATHTIENFESVNAVYTDIDIEETKEIAFDEDLKRREDKMAIIRGRLWFAPLEPSLIIETRNGAQAYWLTNCDLPIFKRIQQGIYEYFQDIGADKAAMKEVQLMRVPGFYIHKNGEKKKAEIFHELCAKYEDGSLVYYKASELLAAFPVKTHIVLKKISAKYQQRQKDRETLFHNLDDVFRKITKMPILEVFEKINSTELVGGKTLEFRPSNNNKVQIRIDGKATPNWIDTEKNMVFSNNQEKFASVFHYCMYYGFTKAELAEKFKNLFFNKKGRAASEEGTPAIMQ